MTMVCVTIIYCILYPSMYIRVIDFLSMPDIPGIVNTSLSFYNEGYGGGIL